MEDQYTKKYNLLLEKYIEIDVSNEKLQNRIYHIRKQIRYLRKLKRLLIQKLLANGDRFMDVCLEIPDMEPGANVEDQIIRRVAEVPQQSTTPIQGYQQATTSRSSTAHSMPSSVSAVSSSPSEMAPPMRKRRRTTLTPEDSGAMYAPTVGTDTPRVGQLGRSASAQHRKSLAVISTSSGSTPASSSHLPNRSESVDHANPSGLTCSSQFHQVPASVEDVVNSVVFDCQRHQRDKFRLDHAEMPDDPTVDTPNYEIRNLVKMEDPERNVKQEIRENETKHRIKTEPEESKKDVFSAE